VFGITLVPKIAEIVITTGCPRNSASYETIFRILRYKNKKKDVVAYIRIIFHNLTPVIKNG
jgi:hypothetical protein